MKKLILITALIICPAAAFAQTTLDFLENIAGVEMVVVTKDAFELLSKFNPEKFKEGNELKVFQMAEGVEEFKMFSSKEPSIAKKIATLSLDAIKKQNLVQITSIKENDALVKIYAQTKRNKEFVTNLVLFVREIDLKSNDISEAMIILLKGTINIQKIPALAAIFVKNNG